MRAGKARTEYVGYQKYMEELQAEAGEIDPDLERLVREIERNDAFWGDMPAIVAKQDE